jgi:hypothetical protein
MLIQIIVDCFSTPLRPWPKELKSCEGGILEMPLFLSKLAVGAGM